jgi:hypothetical protein
MTARREPQAPKWIEKVVPPGAYAGGYKAAKWGMTRTQVDQALGLPLVGESSVTYSDVPRKQISYDMGEGRRLTARFMLDRLYNVTYDFEAGGYKTDAEKQIIIDALTAKYGKPVYEPHPYVKENPKLKNAGNLVWYDGETRIQTHLPDYELPYGVWEVMYSPQRAIVAKLEEAYAKMSTEHWELIAAQNKQEQEVRRRTAEAHASADL